MKPLRLMYDWYAKSFGWGQCRRCGIPWQFADGHSVQYTETSGLFAMCEKCWGETSPDERVNYYAKLVDSWIERGYFNEKEQDGVTREGILQAVREDRQSDYYGWWTA